MKSFIFYIYKKRQSVLYYLGEDISSENRKNDMNPTRQSKHSYHCFISPYLALRQVHILLHAFIYTMLILTTDKGDFNIAIYPMQYIQ